VLIITCKINLNQQSCRGILVNKLKTEKADFFRKLYKKIFKGIVCVNFYDMLLGQVGYRKNMVFII
jgi:hypothetical protein